MSLKTSLKTGSSIDALLSAVRSNASTNKNSAEKIPTITYIHTDTTTATGGVELVAGGTLTTYMTNLTTMTNDVEKSHMYDVVLGYNDAGLVSTITITY